jgi:hypothetical protein
MKPENHFGMTFTIEEITILNSMILWTFEDNKVKMLFRDIGLVLIISMGNIKMKYFNFRKI